MDKLELFENEVLVTSSNDGAVTLTTRRIRYTDKEQVTSMMLEKISAIQILYRSSLILLLLAIIIGVAGLGLLTNNQEGEGLVALGLGVALAVAYLFTRKHVITITSDGGVKIDFMTQGMKRESVLDFINKVEKQKALLI